MAQALRVSAVKAIRYVHCGMCEVSSSHCPWISKDENRRIFPPALKFRLCLAKNRQSFGLGECGITVLFSTLRNSTGNYYAM